MIKISKTNDTLNLTHIRLVSTIVKRLLVKEVKDVPYASKKVTVLITVTFFISFIFAFGFLGQMNALIYFSIVTPVALVAFLFLKRKRDVKVSLVKKNYWLKYYNAFYSKFPAKLLLSVYEEENPWVTLLFSEKEVETALVLSETFSGSMGELFETAKSLEK